MKKKGWIAGVGLAALVPVLIALPGHSAGAKQGATIAGQAPRSACAEAPGHAGPAARGRCRIGG